MVGQAVEQRRRHLGVAKHARPFAECEVCCHDYRRLLIQPADQVEQQLTASMCERQIAEFIEDDEVLAAKLIGHVPLASGSAFSLKSVDQIDDIEEPASGTAADASTGNGDGKMAFSGAGSPDQYDSALVRQEVAPGRVAHQRLVDWRAIEAEVVDILGQRQLGDVDLVFDRACLLLIDLGSQ